MNLGNVEKIKAELKIRNDEDYQKGDLHQSILNIGYEWWQKHEEEDVHYHDMILHMLDNFGELSALAILCGKYNYQVENGGHAQYFDNGYASMSSKRKFLSPENDDRLHQLMIQLAQKLGFEKDELGKKVIAIWKRFEIVEEDEDDYDAMHPYYCIYDADHLDHAYYEINNAWMKHFGNILKENLKVTHEIA